MRASDAVTALRQILQAPSTGPATYSEAEMVRALNQHVRSLSRKMAEVDEGYLNHTLTLLAANARNKYTGIWEYTVPPWIQRVTQVFEKSGTTTPTGRGIEIKPAHKNGGCGWFFNGPLTFRLQQYAAAKDIEVTVAKNPARITKGTLPAQTSMSTTQMRMDVDTSADALNYPHETIQDSYANAVVEITGNHARAGQMRRVTGSTHFQDLAGTRYTVLTVEPAWTTAPLADDTYEFHLDIADEHCQLVLLLAANTVWGSRGKRDEQRAMAPELAHEMNEFSHRITPRQNQQAYYLTHSIQGFPPTWDYQDRRAPLWT